MKFFWAWIIFCLAMFFLVFFVAPKLDDYKFVPCEVVIGGSKQNVFVSFQRNDVEYDCSGGYRQFGSRFSCYIVDKETLPSFFSYFRPARSFHIFAEATFLGNDKVHFSCRFENFSPANRKEGSILQKVILENEYPEPYRIFESVARQIFIKFNPPLKMKSEKE